MDCFWVVAAGSFACPFGIVFVAFKLFSGRFWVGFQIAVGLCWGSLGVIRKFVLRLLGRWVAGMLGRWNAGSLGCWVAGSLDCHWVVCGSLANRFWVAFGWIRFGLLLSCSFRVGFEMVFGIAFGSFSGSHSFWVVFFVAIQQLSGVLKPFGVALGCFWVAIWHCWVVFGLLAGRNPSGSDPKSNDQGSRNQKGLKSFSTYAIPERCFDCVFAASNNS